MSDLDLLRSIAPPTTAPSPDAYALARRRLDARIARSTGRFRRRRWLAPAVVAIVAATVTLALGLRGHGQESAAAALLRTAAASVQAQQPLVPTAGEYLYVKSEGAHLALDTDSPPWAVLVPETREAWFGLDGGRVYATSGRPIFLNDRDRANWIASGRPALPVSDRPSDTHIPARVPSLPTDPDQLYRQLADQAKGKSAGFAWSMFQLIGDTLRETITTPEQRAALYEVAARVPGIELVGNVIDRIGRPAVAVAVLSESETQRLELLLDPRTYDLLGEEETVLAGNVFGYPPGTVTGYTTYLRAKIVGPDHARP